MTRQPETDTIVEVILCPFHDDSDPSLKVYADGHAHCYACNTHVFAGTPEAAALLRGDALSPEVAARLRRIAESPDQAAAMRQMARETRHPILAVMDDLARDPLDAGLDVVYHNVLLRYPDALPWLIETRGLTMETLERERIGYAGDRWVLPVYNRYGSPEDDDRGRILTFRFRLDPEWVLDPETIKRKKYCGLPGRNGLLLYGYWWLGPAVKHLVLCEGELDALRLQQEFWRRGMEKVAAVSATNGASQMGAALDLIRALVPTVTEVTLASDQDDAGEKAAVKVMRAEKARKDSPLHLTRLTWDPQAHGKDVTEWLQTGGQPMDLFDAKGLPDGDQRDTRTKTHPGTQTGKTRVDRSRTVAASAANTGGPGGGRSPSFPGVGGGRVDA